MFYTIYYPRPFRLGNAEGYCRRPCVGPSVCPSGLATGYLWTTLSVQRSLLASRVTYRNFPTSDDDNSRQNPQIRREIRKKIFRDKFFSDENLSESVQNILITIGNTSTSHWPGLSHEAPRDLSRPMRIEKIDLRPPTKLSDMRAQRSRHIASVLSVSP